MNGAVIGTKQLVVRLHEPKQLRQEKLAQRFGGAGNGHPRSTSGATSPTASEGGDSAYLGPGGQALGWASPGARTAKLGYNSQGASPRFGSLKLEGMTKAGGQGAGSGHGQEKTARRGSGSYYNVSDSHCHSYPSPIQHDSPSSMSLVPWCRPRSQAR